MLSERIQFLTNILALSRLIDSLLTVYVIKYSCTGLHFIRTWMEQVVFRLYRTGHDNRHDIQCAKIPINVLLLGDKFRSINAATYTVAT